MKLYCNSCKEKVAEILTGSSIRKGAVMVCRECMERLQIADDIARMSRSATPDFITDLFKEKDNV
jgi:hypothetical protein